MVLINNEDLINQSNSDALFKSFFQYSLDQFGELKLSEISNKIHSSERVLRFLKQARQINLQLGTDDFIGCVHSMLTFTFSKAEIIAIASVILLEKWKNDIGIPQGLADDAYLNKILFAILERCNGFKTHLNNQLNFFERFYKLVDKTHKENESQKPKTEIFLNHWMCKAIQDNIKSELRISDNLELINIAPDEWILERNEKDGLTFYCKILDKRVFVNSPFILGNIIKVCIPSTQAFVEIVIESRGLQRFRDIDQYDAIQEGFSIYKEEISKILEEDYGAEAELILFERDWMMAHKISGRIANHWLWVFKIKHIEPIIAF